MSRVGDLMEFAGGAAEPIMFISEHDPKDLRMLFKHQVSTMVLSEVFVDPKGKRHCKVFITRVNGDMFNGWTTEDSLK